MHEVAATRGLTSLTFEEEMDAAEKDKDTIFATKEKSDTNPEQVAGVTPKPQDAGDDALKGNE